MSGQDLYNFVGDKTSELEKALSKLGRLGRASAMAEREYRVALRKSILVERNKGTPVTIILNLTKGEEEIADLRFKRDCADSLYKACIEGINVLKLELKIINDQIDREWNRR